MPDIEFVRGQIAACAFRFCSSAERSRSFNAPVYPAPQPRRFSIGCSTKSTIFASSVTGSSRSSPKC